MHSLITDINYAHDVFFNDKEREGGEGGRGGSAKLRRS